MNGGDWHTGTISSTPIFNAVDVVVRERAEFGLYRLVTSIDDNAVTGLISFSPYSNQVYLIAVADVVAATLSNNERP